MEANGMRAETERNVNILHNIKHTYIWCMEQKQKAIAKSQCEHEMDVVLMCMDGYYVRLFLLRLMLAASTAWDPHVTMETWLVRSF